MFRFAETAELHASERLDDARDHVAAVGASAVRDTRDRVLAFLGAHPDALHRTCAPGHLTGSALVVDPGRGRLLLLHHTKLRRWLQPGGHADGDANLAAVALREATEETGIAGLRVVVPAVDVDIHLVEPPSEQPHHHLDVRFLVVAPEDAEVVANHESTAQRWVEITELEAMGCDPGLQRLAAEGLHTLTKLERPAAG